MKYNLSCSVAKFYLIIVKKNFENDDKVVIQLLLHIFNMETKILILILIYKLVGFLM